MNNRGLGLSERRQARAERGLALSERRQARVERGLALSERRQARVEGFLTRFSPGPAWVTGRPIEEQPGYARQVRWWISMRRRGLLSWAGIPVNHPEQLYFRWHVNRLSEAKKLAATAPFVRRGVLREATLRTASRA